jgi:hypothetical protein
VTIDTQSRLRDPTMHALSQFIGSIPSPCLHRLTVVLPRPTWEFLINLDWTLLTRSVKLLHQGLSGGSPISFRVLIIGSQEHRPSSAMRLLQTRLQSFRGFATVEIEYALGEGHGSHGLKTPVPEFPLLVDIFDEDWVQSWRRLGFT